MKKLKLSVMAISLMLPAGLVFAQLDSSATPATGVSPSALEERRALQAEIQKKAEQLRLERERMAQDLKTQGEATIVENRALLEGMSTSTRAETLEQVRENRDALLQNREEARAGMEEQRNAYREEVRKRIEERVNARLGQALSSLSKLVERLIDINSRLETRISAMETEGLNVSEIKTLSSEAKTKADIASSKVEYARSVISQGVTDKESLEAVKTAFQTAHEAYKDARKKTEETIKAVRALIVSQRPAGTSTTPFQR